MNERRWEIAVHQMGRMPYEVWPDWEEMADLASGGA